MSKKTTPPEVKIPDAVTLTAEKATALLPERLRSSKYGAMITAMQALKPGSAIAFPFAKSVDVRRVINNLTGAMINQKIKAPAGYGFYKSIGTGNELVILLKPRKGSRKGK